ncbi:cytochrome P450 [Coprinopsis marcescibilis]|uniref:Cytochrome P450 n=1 Tax=Coprinopsis marcescibilis TaxID=230819 RepID=A0A5C3KQR1_COPMA|nr:cytochrome P450 [Coprinopsis marcescibilis]
MSSADHSQYLHQLSALSARQVAGPALLVVLGTWFLLRRFSSSRVRTPKLKGPTGNSLLFGVLGEINRGNSPALFDKWAKEYGTTFSIDMGFGKTGVVLGDVKAIAHFLARDTLTYRQMKFNTVLLELILGPGLLWAEGEVHRRQRRPLTPAFSNSSIRGYLDVFYANAHKLKSQWEGIIDSGSSTIDVQNWIAKTALDNLGIAGFGHSFGSLDGNEPEVVGVFDNFRPPSEVGAVSKIMFLLAPLIPALLSIPTDGVKLLASTKAAMKPIAEGLIQSAKRQISQAQDTELSKSIIGLLIKAECAESGTFGAKSEEVILAQRTILFAGYETTTYSLSWAFIELSRNLEVQQRLRKELMELGTDPTYEQLMYGLPYLNAVVQESLRLHVPVPNIVRVAHEDDMIPLSAPITTTAGMVISELPIAKGTSVWSSFTQVNQSEEIWGADAKAFKPERWLDDNLTAGAKSIQGYHHILTFSDGQRICLGRAFAIANIKSTLSVLVRNFEFELPDGPDTPIGVFRAAVARPKVDSETGSRLPLKVRRAD